MLFVFTICSNNYLAQAQVLGNSLKQFHPEVFFLIILVDEKHKDIDYQSIQHEVLPIQNIEPRLQDLLLKYDIIELNTSIKPGVIEYLFTERNAQTVVYLDPDIKVYDALTELFHELKTKSIVLTPHIYSPIPLDGRKPAETTFLNFGIYNLGFIGLQQNEETKRFVQWWKERTYQMGYVRVHEGIFVDQLYINHVPLFFKEVSILEHKGYNMAPWNLHERYLSYIGDKFFVNRNEALKFYHFSSFRVDSGELPLHHYDRFTMSDRPDLQQLYDEYNTDLKNAGYSFYSAFKCEYMLQREAFIKEKENEAWKNKPIFKRIALQFINKLRSPLKKVMYQINR